MFLPSLVSEPPHSAGLSAEDKALIQDVYAKTRTAMLRVMIKHDPSWYARDSARQMKYRRDAAFCRLVFVFLDSKELALLRPAQINGILAESLGTAPKPTKVEATRGWPASDETKSNYHYFRFPKDVTYTVKHVEELGICHNEVGKRRKKWGRPTKAEEMADHCHLYDSLDGGFPSYYCKSPELEELEALFSKPDARLALFLALAQGGLLLAFFWFTLEVSLRVLRMDSATANIVSKVTIGSVPEKPSWLVEIIRNGRLDDDAALRRLAGSIAVEMLPRLVDLPLYLFALLFIHRERQAAG